MKYTITAPVGHFRLLANISKMTYYGRPGLDRVWLGRGSIIASDSYGLARVKLAETDFPAEADLGVPAADFAEACRTASTKRIIGDHTKATLTFETYEGTDRSQWRVYAGDQWLRSAAIEEPIAGNRPHFEGLIEQAETAEEGGGFSYNPSLLERLTKSAPKAGPVKQRSSGTMKPVLLTANDGSGYDWLGLIMPVRGRDD